MKVYIHSLSYLPRVTSGAVRYNHSLAKHLIQMGCEVKVIVDQIRDPYEHDGVEVYSFPHHERLMRWADVVMCEPGRFKLCQAHPNVVVLQHTVWPATWDYRRAKVIYCAEHVQKKCKYECRNSMVLYPWNRYEKGKKPGRNAAKNITLINCNANKGGPIMPALAVRMPARSFLGVKGDYGQQYIYNHLTNLTYTNNTEDIWDIYADTAVLIVPSAAEGFPTVGIEAMSFGIPVTGFPIDGVKELVGGSAPVAKGSSAPHLVKALSLIFDDYAAYSKAAKVRASEIEKARNIQLSELMNFLAS